MTNSNGYSEENASKILESLHKKGWNLYDYGELTLKGPTRMIEENLADKIELGTSYMMLPFADDPKSLKQVTSALERLKKEKGENLPTITIGRDIYPLTGITLLWDDVRIHTSNDTYVPYSTFMQSLESIVQANHSKEKIS